MIYLGKIVSGSLIQRPAILFFAILLAFSSCFSPYRGDDAVISIDVGGSAARGIIIKDEDISRLVHIVTVSNTAGETQTRRIEGVGNATFVVTQGEWNITVYAFLADDTGEEYIMAIGDETIGISGGTNDVSVKMEANPGIGGDGTVGNPFLVYSPTTLNMVGRDYENNGSGWTLFAHYKLITDITLPVTTPGESNWTRIGFDDSPFTGTFDGNGKTISNLTINDDPVSPFLSSFQGMFGAVRGDAATGTVKNLNLQDVNINAPSSDYVGAIAGANFGGEISNCHIIGTSSVEGRSYVGGVAGSNDSDGIISYSSSTGNVEGYENTGGVAGANSDTISYSFSTGDVTGTDNSIGGVVGNNDGGTIRYCSWTGNDVTGRDYIGGVAGYYKGTIIENCFAAGDVEGASFVGGVAGGVNEAVDPGPVIRNSYYAGGTVTANGPSSTSRGTVAGGIVGYNGGALGLVENCYATGIVKLVTVYVPANSYIGGIGGQPGKVKNSVALTTNIDPSTAANFGRIRGDSSSTEDDNNYGNDMMTPTPSGGWINDANDKDGENVGVSALNEAWWTGTLGWSTDDWDFTDPLSPTLNWVMLGTPPTP